MAWDLCFYYFNDWELMTNPMYMYHSCDDLFGHAIYSGLFNPVWLANDLNISWTHIFLVVDVICIDTHHDYCYQCTITISETYNWTLTIQYVVIYISLFGWNEYSSRQLGMINLYDWVHTCIVSMTFDQQNHYVTFACSYLYMTT